MSYYTHIFLLNLWDNLKIIFSPVYGLQYLQTSFFLHMYVLNNPFFSETMDFSISFSSSSAFRINSVTATSRRQVNFPLQNFLEGEIALYLWAVKRKKVLPLHRVLFDILLDPRFNFRFSPVNVIKFLGILQTVLHT